VAQGAGDPDRRRRARNSSASGQGAAQAQAIEDGVVLGELLAEDAPLEQLLQTFMQRRYERCKLIFHASLQVGEWEQHPTADADPAGLMARMIGVFARPI
jgi:2-polyprenyl-6-methoxyphenol hydroxylase-like FAD-dependent oxidoreductase